MKRGDAEAAEEFAEVLFISAFQFFSVSAFTSEGTTNLTNRTNPKSEEMIGAGIEWIEEWIHNVWDRTYG